MRIALLAALLLALGAATAAPAAGPPTRRCGQAISFSGPPVWGQTGALVAGPLSFTGLADHPAGQRQPDGRWFVKSVLLVKPGAAVTVELVPGSSARAALYYAYRNSQAVRFVPCPGRVAAFSGGFLIRRLRCATILVRAAGGQTYRRTIDFRGFLGGSCA